MDRHRRQSCLSEVGLLGQARIAAMVAEVPAGGLAGEVAARYLAGAGVAALRVREAVAADGARALAPSLHVEVDGSLRAPEDSAPASWGLRDPAARQLAWGACIALRAVRRALEGGR